MDLYRKVEKAKNIKGFRYIEILAPCHPGWKLNQNETIRYSRLAVKTKSWLLWEAENGKVELNNPTKNLLTGKAEAEPLESYISGQGRFKHIMKSPDKESFLQQIAADNEAGIKLLLQRLAD